LSETALLKGNIYVHYGAVDEFRGRQFVEPLRSGRVDGGYVPQDSVAAAAFGLSGN
jgi:hypothetical protein